jgi:hypothetical protein
MPEGSQFKLVAQGSHKVYRQKTGKTLMREYQWNLSQGNASFNSTLLRAELRRAPRSDWMTRSFLDYTITNNSGAPIRFWSLLSCVEKLRVLINSVEVLHYNSNELNRFALKDAWLKSYRDSRERDNDAYVESGQASFLDGSNEIDAVSIGAGLSVNFHTDMAKLIPFFHNLPMSAVGLVEVEITLSSISTQVCDGSAADLSISNMRFWSDHKHWSALPPQPFASHTLHFSDHEVYRLQASQTPFVAGLGQYDIQCNTLFPSRRHISALSIYAVDSAGTDPFIRDVPNWVNHVDILRNGVSFRENVLDTKQKFYAHVLRHLRSKGLYAPTRPTDTGHSSAFPLQYVHMSPVVEHTDDTFRDVKSTVASEVDNRDNLVLRIFNDTTLTATTEIVVVLTYDAFWRLSPNGGVVKVEA